MSQDSWAGARGERWLAQIDGMEATLQSVDEPLIDALDLRGPRRVADVGCGGGRTTLEVFRRAPKGSVVHGFDISPALIEMARRRLPPETHDIAFELADAAKAIPKPAFERLVSRFGVMFFEDPSSAFSNLAQWLVSGGRFAFAVWGPVADNPWMTSAREAVAAVAEVPVLDPEGPGPFRYADAAKLVSLLERAGFRDLNVRDWRGTLPMGGGLPSAGAANFALTAISTFGELLAAAGDEARQKAHAQLAQRYAHDEKGGVVHVDARVHIVTGGRA